MDETKDRNANNRRSWPRRVLNRMEVDQAVFFAVASRAWQFLAGPVTLVLIGTYFSPEVQGYFYTFASLLALQSFVELGFHIAIINVTSHEWAKLGLDEQGNITGNAASLSRLVSLGHLICKWYGAASVLFAVGVGAAGIGFFSLKPSAGVNYVQPWMALVMLSALLLWTLPFAALLEGCNQVATVNRFRLLQAVTGNLAVWTCILLGAGLWTAVASAAVRLFWEVYLLAVRYRRFFKPFFAAASGSVMQWRTEIWPLQWRLAVQGVFGYFMFALYTPVMFHYQGPEAAGQMGMSWSALTAIQAASLAWVQTRVPLFGMLIAKRDFRELDRVFKRLTAVSLLAAAAGGVLFWAVVFGLNMLEHPLAARVLPPLPLGIFTVAVMAQLVGRCVVLYIQAHKQDPLIWISVTASLATGLLVWLLGSRYGSLGAGLGLLAVVLLYALPCRTLGWLHYRAAWHQGPDDAARRS